MKENFDLVFRHLLGHEGGYSNDPQDRGGPTRWGVTLAVLRAWRKNDDLSARAVQELTVDEAKQIFRHRYWDLVKADELPSGIDYAVVDFAYNSGVDRASRALQRQLRIGVDGNVATLTVDACRKIDPVDLDEFIGDYCDARMAFLKTTYGWPRFKNGWTKRVKGVRKVSLALVVDPGAPAVEKPAPAPQPADKQVVALSPQKTANETTAIGTIGTIFTETAQKIAPHVDALVTAKYLFLALTVLSMTAAMWIAWRKMTKESS